MHISLSSLSIMQNTSLPQSYIRSKAISVNSYYCVCLELLFVCFWCDSPPVGQGLLIHEVSGSHTMTHHSRYDSSG